MGSGNAISCNDVAKFIVEKLNSKSKIRYIPMRIGEAIDTKIVAKSHSELLKKLNIKLEYSMEKTLEDCINYMKSLDTKEILRAYNFFKNWKKK